jgi:hypothetical protein
MGRIFKALVLAWIGKKLIGRTRRHRAEHDAERRV